jgi:hypothetical protein
LRTQGGILRPCQHHHLLGFVTKVDRLRKPPLLDDDDRGDDQRDRDRELEHDERLAQRRCSRAARDLPAQRACGLERRKQERGIAAGTGGDEQRDCDDRRYDFAPREVAVADAALDERCERRERRDDDDDRNGDRNHGQQHRLADELSNQLRSGAANGLAQPDLLRTLSRPSGREIHEVDAGD